MNKRLFFRDERQARLRELYRAAEERTDLRDLDRDVQRAFTVDQQLMRQLADLAAYDGPAHAEAGRAALLAAVARKRSESQAKERPPMIGQLLTGRALALIATAGIFAGGAASVGASGGVSGAAGNVQDVLAALHVTDRTPDQADTHLDNVSQPDGSGKPSDAGAPASGAGLNNAQQHANDNADSGLQNAGERASNAGDGIDNASPQGLDHADSHATDGPSSSSSVPGTAPTVALPTQANEHAGEAPVGTPVPLPTEASQHAADGAGNAPVTHP